MNILVPIDFTPESKAGLLVALDIASRTGAHISLLHVIHEPAPVGVLPKADLVAKQQEINEEEHFMSELIRKMKGELKLLTEQLDTASVEVKSFLAFGSYNEGLEEHLEEHPADLIVMGSSGETSIAEWFKGNHATRTMRIADIPTLVIKDNQKISLGGELLVLVGIRDYRTESIARIREFAEAMRMNVHIAHVTEPHDLLHKSISDRLEDFARAHGFTDYKVHVIESGQKVEQVQAFVEAWHIDVVASISEGDSGIARLIYGSDTEDFINHVDKPVLAVTM
ncbi:universal stress protein [Reichenbachiella sp. MSK19-1]|uniref:universal stress protein n=1 Tax=Reichenbachiella sp. MSK19-1 TaxID=1897631 RepID=UPI000E6D3096|nr:universal stress protein [Reichenbachiella sp. MSK19-1]RJE74785.1 hypothetical protein BGP76_16775 [Reichenbachiella sp. MSK19-1]